MSGYAVRSKPSEGVLQDIWAKALAFEDSKGGRVIIVTTDLIGLPRSVSEVVSARVLKEHGIERARLILNSSHTHTGPVVRANLAAMYNLSDDQQRAVDEYTRDLIDNLVSVSSAAIGDLKPAKVEFGKGTAPFAINRRQFNAKGVSIGTNSTGPVDHDVPVIRVTGPDGSLRAVLFGYACHNTTLTGEFYQISGDYAGFAQAELERQHPGATALFLMLCGADQNPNPRSSLQLAEQHGKTLAGQVSEVLKGKLSPLKPPIRAALQVVDLSFVPHTRDTFEEELKSDNQFKVRRAQAMLKGYDEGRPVRRVTYPVQAVRFGDSLALVTLGGEVVVDYSLRTKREYPKENVVVAGYSNDVMCYIPSKRVLKEGGYEANDSMIYYGQPGPFTEEVEESIFSAIGSVMERVGAKKAK
jgi:neutral ceramidase